MKTKQRLLLALHEPVLQASTRLYIEAIGGYQVVAVSSLSEMFDEIYASMFHAYIMDTNLGLPGMETYKPAEIVYKYLPEHSKFVSITGHCDLVDQAVQAGIPCIHKIHFPAYFKKHFTKH